MWKILNRNEQCILFIVIMFILLNNFLYSQVLTPEGKPLGGLAYTQSEFSRSPIDLVTYYNLVGDSCVEDMDLKATRVGDASRTYNCHAYAWRVSEGGSKVWINSPGDDYYWSDENYSNDDLASYIPCIPSEATHVSYVVLMFKSS